MPEQTVDESTKQELAEPTPKPEETVVVPKAELEKLKTDMEAFQNWREYAQTAMQERPPEPEPEPEKVDDDALESMSRAEFAKFQQEQIVGAIEKQVKALVDPVTQEIQTVRAEADIERTAAKHKDFWDFKQDMVNISKNIPGVTAEQAYALAKSQHTEVTPPPEKKEEVDAKIDRATSTKPGEATEEVMRQVPGDAEQAAKQAWNETMGPNVKSI